MSNETKRDVFEDALRALEEFGEQGSSWEMAYDDLSARYSTASDTALPDDIPVIPKAQSDWIKQCKANDDSLSFALDDETTPIEVSKTFRVWGGYTDKNKDKWLKLQNTFARAWLYGVWCVEGTGEIVNLK